MSIEQYLLTCLSEECAELAQAASKANRFGLDDVYPPKPTINRDDIRVEFNDILAVIELMQANGILALSDIMDRKLIEAKKEKLSRMINYSAQRGRVEARPFNV